ncbi:MAG: SIR2 family protein [Halanaerobiaceae bacterium]
MARRVSILLGAGISIPAGIPTTGDITEKLLKGKAYYSTKDERYREDNECKNHSHQDITKIIKFISCIKNKISNFYTEKQISYEDIYYVITQIEDFLQEYENPVVESFVTDLINDLIDTGIFSDYNESQISGYSKLTGNDYQLPKNDEVIQKYISRLARMSSNYINDMLSHYLALDNGKLQYLRFIKEIYQKENIESINIFTLNHDILLEKYFRKESLNFNDGFREDEDLSAVKIRIWDPDFINSWAKVNLLKLHGSINWFRFRSKSNNKYRGYFFGALSSNNMPEGTLPEGGPLILTGRFNKIMEYNRSIYVDLHYNFYRLLDRTDIFIISGYSFNDKGINSWLIDWMYSSPEHSIILIHPHPEKCIEQARYGIKHHWPGWKKKEKIIVIPVPIEDFSWSDCSSKI